MRRKSKHQNRTRCLSSFYQDLFLAQRIFSETRYNQHLLSWDNHSADNPILHYQNVYRSCKPFIYFYFILFFIFFHGKKLALPVASSGIAEDIDGKSLGGILQWLCITALRICTFLCFFLFFLFFKWLGLGACVKTSTRQLTIGTRKKKRIT